MVWDSRFNFLLCMKELELTTHRLQGSISGISAAFRGGGRILHPCQMLLHFVQSSWIFISAGGGAPVSHLPCVRRVSRRSLHHLLSIGMATFKHFAQNGTTPAGKAEGDQPHKAFDLLVVGPFPGKQVSDELSKGYWMQCPFTLFPTVTSSPCHMHAFPVLR